MKRSNRAFTWLVLMALLLSAAFAVDRFLAMHSASAECEGAIDDLRRANVLLSQQAGPLTSAPSGDRTTQVKRLIQERCQRNKINPGYQVDGEGEGGRGFRERTVTLRFYEVPHVQLVTFLSDMEQMGDGVTAKELKVNPSDRQPGFYKLAECILAWRCPDEKAGVGGAR
jgi:hypothetical protein